MVRYRAGHKEATRKQIVKTASRRFRRDGIGGAGVASLMAEAGLTHGGFYNHFRSKEDLVASALVSALDESLIVLKRRADEMGGGLDGLLRAYLDISHRDRPEDGCALAALCAEVARQPDSTKQVFGTRVEAFLALIAEELPESMAKAEKQQRSLAILSLMSGALQLARIYGDETRSLQALEAGVRGALKLAKA